MNFKLVIARMDTPQYGETLKFVYTKYQPILVIKLVILKKGIIQIAGGGSRTPASWLGGVEISENIKCYPY